MVRKAVIPAAGYGTRFLPLTKSQPKEMVPLLDKPAIQYVVEEAVASGIKDILLIIGRGKRALEEHFSRNYELEDQLKLKNKQKELDLVKSLPDDVNIHFVWQHDQLGLGHAIRCAKDHVGNEPFAVLLGDTVVDSETDVPVTRQLMDFYSEYEEAILALEEVPLEMVSRYGVIDGLPVEDRDGLFRIRDIVEKPDPEKAPSRLVVASRYVLPPEIFSALDMVTPGKGGEIQLTDALGMLVKDREMYGLRFRGSRYDLGNKLDWLKANIRYALKDEEMMDEMKRFLKEIIV